jgi:hypothetical protein
LQVADVALLPDDFIFARFIDQTNAFEHICDVINSSLGNAQQINSLIQVNAEIRARVPDDIDEAPGQLA